MKVTYEFDTAKKEYDHTERLMIENAEDMYNSLYEIANILRGWEKGWDYEDMNPREAADKLVERITQEVQLSKIWEID